jgi:hypothetical protein
VIPAQLSMVVLSTRDVPALSGFYRSLGWPEQAGGSETLCRFQLGTVVLALYKNEDSPDEVLSPSEGRPATTLVIRFGSANEVDSAHGEAIRAGAQPVSGPTDQAWGGRSAVVADPDGNRWELLWVPVPGSNGSNG